MSNLALQLLPVGGERIASGRVKGALIRAHLDWVRDYASREETIELFEALPASVRHEVATLLPGAWYDFATLVTVDHTILSRFGNDDPSFFEQLGAYMARRIDAHGVHEFLRQAAGIHRQLHDFGLVEYIQLTRTAGVICHHHAPSWSPLHCAALTGFYRQSVVLHGGTEVEVEETECRCTGARSCNFAVAWK